MSLLSGSSGYGGSSYYSSRRRRGRSRTLLIVLLVLLLVAAAATGVWWQFFRTTAAAPTAISCPTPTPTPASASPSGEPLPAPSTITVTVLNTTARNGLAKGVADAYAARGFKLGQVTNAPAGTKVAGAAEIRFGPGGQLAARVVAAQVGDPATVGQVAAPLPPGTVQLLLGAAFTKVNAPDVAAKILAPSPTPVPVASGCPAA